MKSFSPVCCRRFTRRIAPVIGGALFVAVCLFVGLTSARADDAAASQAKVQKPRLAVILVFDQMRGDYLSRWQDLFGKDGFSRLKYAGAWFTNCHYPYALTVTAAGHASLSTGCSPREHGIVGNDWFDWTAGERRSSVESGYYRRVPSLGGTDSTLRDTSKKEITGISPGALVAPTFADALLEATDNKARIVSLSLKDRAAVMLGSHRKSERNSCYWFDTASGTFVTSSYYRNQLEDWVEQYNTSYEGRTPADRWLGKSWERLRTDVDYVLHVGPDDGPGEGTGFRQGRVFPHPFGASDKPGKDYYDALLASPFGNELLLGLAKRAIDGAKLGTRDVPDLLCVSFSSNDLVGHQWGPDSQEVLDVTLRADALVAELLTFLDARPGLKDRYVVAVSADHGICPLPEAVLQNKFEHEFYGDDKEFSATVAAMPKGGEPKRVGPKQLKHWAADILKSHYNARLLLETADIWLYLDRAELARLGLTAAAVEDVLAEGLKRLPDVQAVYTRTQLDAGLPADDRLGQAVAHSYFPARSGDLAVILRPYHPLSGFDDGTTHGTPYPYDTHVPLLVYGPGVLKGIHSEASVPQALPVILARALGIEPPAGARTPLPKGVMAPP